MIEVVSWDELLKPENGFVDDANNKSIAIEIEIKMNKPEGIDNHQKDGAAGTNHAAKRRKMECLICFETISSQDVSSTKCGHVFCKPCITKSVNAYGKCPSCNTVVTVNDLFSVYLPL